MYATARRAETEEPPVNSRKARAISEIELQILRTSGAAEAIDIVTRIERAGAEFTRAERRVAAAVARDFDAATRMTIAELANLAGVSQPTITRFCRSLGCASFGEFKIQLAATLAVAAVYLKSHRVFRDDIGQLAQTVMMRASAAVHECLDALDTEALGKAMDVIAGAGRVDIYGQGSGSAAVAEDARLRLFRLGLAVTALSDGQQQRMSAATLGLNDTALAISNSGRSVTVIEATRMAASLGASTIAITRPGSPLAEVSGIVIPVTIAEGQNVLVPSPSRYAHLAVVDTLAAGVAERLGPRARDALRRVRYTLASIGVAIPAPETDPEPIMKNNPPRE